MENIEEMEIEVKNTIDLSLWNQCQTIVSNYQIPSGDKNFNQVNSVLALKDKGLYEQMIQDIARVFYTDTDNELVKNICSYIIKELEKTLLAFAGGALPGLGVKGGPVAAVAGGVYWAAMRGMKNTVKGKVVYNKTYIMKDAIKIFTIHTIINDPTFIEKKNEYFIQKNGLLKDKADDIINNWKRESELFIEQCKYGIINKNTYENLKLMFEQIPEGKKISTELKNLYIKLCDLEVDFEIS